VNIVHIYMVSIRVTVRVSVRLKVSIEVDWAFPSPREGNPPIPVEPGTKPATPYF